MMSAMARQSCGDACGHEQAAASGSRVRDDAGPAQLPRRRPGAQADAGEPVASAAGGDRRGAARVARRDAGQRPARRCAIERSLAHGHVAAVLGVLRDLDLERLLSRERCRERDLCVALICQRLLAPGSKLSATRRFAQTTLADELELGAVSERELLGAMDWLLERQERIERTLARRHLAADGYVLYDLSSSYVEGRCCPLAQIGYSRDGKRGSLQVNYGLICAPDGRPVAIELHAGNTGDPATVPAAAAAVARALRDRARRDRRRSRHADRHPDPRT